MTGYLVCAVIILKCCFNSTVSGLYMYIDKKCLKFSAKNYC